MILSKANTIRVSNSYYRTAITKKNCLTLVKALVKLSMWYVIERGKSTVLWCAKNDAKAIQLRDLVA